MLEGWVSILINIVVFVVKLVPGIVIGSVALVADAFHSLSDVVTSVVVIVGFWLSARPSDPKHPFGHGRAESVASLVIAALLFLTAWEFGQASVERLLRPRAIAAPWWLIAVLVVSIVLKEWLSQFALALGKAINSTALIGDFWHHRSDVFATAIVILALLASNVGLWWVDGLGGLAVSGIIAWAAWRLVPASIDPLIGDAPSPQLIAEVSGVAMSVPGVDSVHDVIVHRYGSLVVPSLHVEVSSRLGIEDGHEVAEEVEARLNRRYSSKAVVHVDPVDRSHPLYADVRTFLEETVVRIPGANGFHDLRIVGSERRPFILFDLSAEGDEAEAVADRVREAVERRYPQAGKVGINLRPRYVY